jgi:hypothetical protein
MEAYPIELVEKAYRNKAKLMPIREFRKRFRRQYKCLFISNPSPS